VTLAPATFWKIYSYSYRDRVVIKNLGQQKVIPCFVRSSSCWSETTKTKLKMMLFGGIVRTPPAEPQVIAILPLLLPLFYFSAAEKNVFWRDFTDEANHESSLWKLQATTYWHVGSPQKSTTTEGHQLSSSLLLSSWVRCFDNMFLLKSTRAVQLAHSGQNTFSNVILFDVQFASLLFVDPNFWAWMS
jgi:hypothetical protein